MRKSLDAVKLQSLEHRLETVDWRYFIELITISIIEIVFNFLMRAVEEWNSLKSVFPEQYNLEDPCLQNEREMIVNYITYHSTISTMMPCCPCEPECQPKRQMAYHFTVRATP